MVNQLPQGWKEEELGKLADVIAGQSPEGVYYNTVGEGTPFYQGKSEFQEMYLGKPTKWTTKVTKLAKKNDILMSVRAPVGPVNITQEDICIGRGLAAITAKSMLLQLYLFYHLRFLEDKISGTNGAVFASISKREIEQIKITYPTDKDEQDYIVKTLDAVAEMIKLRKETIQLTKDFIPAIFQEMFGDCSENVLIGNNDYFEIEDGDRGNNYPKKEELLEKGDCLFLSAKNVTEDGFVFKENVFISQDKDKKLRTGKLKRHDFVMMTRGTIGNIAYYAPDIPYDNIRINSGMVIIRIKQGFEPLYFLQAMRSDNVKFQIKNLITGAAVPQLPIHLIKKISLKLADNTKQKEFADKLEQINQNLEVQQKDLDRLQELFDQLLQKAFTGELTRGEDYGKH